MFLASMPLHLARCSNSCLTALCSNWMNEWITIVVLFLTLDRSITLLLGLCYRARHGQAICLFGSVTATINAILACTFNWGRSFCLKRKSNTTRKQVNALTSPSVRLELLFLVCFHILNLIFCLFRTPDDVQLTVRIVFGTLNFICSLAFLQLLRRYNSKRVSLIAEGALKNSAGLHRSSFKRTRTCRTLSNFLIS